MITQKTDAANKHYQAEGLRSDRYVERTWIARACFAGMLTCVLLALIIGGA